MLAKLQVESLAWSVCLHIIPLNVKINSMKRLPQFLLFLSFCTGSLPAVADALMRSQAVDASSIAQYYVDEQGVRVELEIGLNSIDAFRNLMPDAIY